MSSAVTSDAASSYLAGQAWGVFIELKGGLMLAQDRRGKRTQFWQGRGLETAFLSFIPWQAGKL